MQGSLSGERFGNYVAHRVLGRGGMGTVYLAEHPDIGRKVAIKVVSRYDDEELIQRFLAEAQAVNRIGHPNIIDIYDFGRTESGRLYYVMEYLEGRELGDLMGERKRMSPEEVLPLLEQLCAAMQAAHEAGVVHRDLKPANIFVLDRHGELRVKVLDFGVAKLLDRPAVGFRTTPGALIGTPMFGAPEQLTAQQDKISPQTDLYAIGVMVYWMLTGRPPFLADNNAVLMSMHIEDPVPPIASRAPSVHPDAAAVIERCLAKVPADRPGSAALLATAFRQAVRGCQAGEAAVVFEPLVDGRYAPGNADVAAEDVEVSTLLEGRKVLLGRTKGVAEEAAGEPPPVTPAASPTATTRSGRREPAEPAEPTEPAVVVARRGGAAAEEPAAVTADQTFDTSTTVEVVREDALRVEPPPAEARTTTAPSTPPSARQTAEPPHAPAASTSGSWSRPDAVARTGGRLKAVERALPAKAAGDAHPASPRLASRRPAKAAWTASAALPWIIATTVALAFAVYLVVS